MVIPYQNRPLSFPNCYAVYYLTSITYCLCRAYSINAALSKKAYPTIIQFEVKFSSAKKMSFAQVLSQHALSGALDENGLSARQKGNRFAKAGSKCSGLKKSNQRWANLNRHKLIQDYPRSHVITVEALPIFSILAAIGNPIVDYFR